MIIVGNVISFIAALFMVASCITRQKEKIFLFQFIDCVLLAVASLFFRSYAGVTTLALSAVRNILVSRNRYTKNVMYVLLVLTVVVGLWTNTRGMIGLLPVIATVQYNICCLYLTGIKATKFSILANIIMWMIYSFAIHDFSTGGSDIIVLIVGTTSIVKMYREERRAALKLAEQEAAVAEKMPVETEFDNLKEADSVEEAVL